jgi:hypothetical protein
LGWGGLTGEIATIICQLISYPDKLKGERNAKRVESNSKKWKKIG